MLIWCSYCQQFVGESAPYDRLVITHGICESCEPNVLTITDSDLVHTLRLKDIQERLAEAGRAGDLPAAARIIEESRKAKVGGVDILIGVIAPMLHQIGEDWRRGIVSVAQEHRFTAFCESVYQLVAAATALDAGAARPPRPGSEVLLVNAPGNRHTLAVRILALWLARKGITAQVADGSLSVAALIAMVTRIQPGILLISLALAEQASCVIAIAERIAALPEHLRPRVIVGGYAVKLGLVSAIPGASLMADISSLVDLESARFG